MASATNWLAVYLEQVPSRPRLSRKQELELIRRSRAGRRAASQTQDGTNGANSAHAEKAVRSGKAAETVLVESFLYKIVQYARRFHLKNGARVALDELVSAGNEGLVKAVTRYDPSRGARFWTCANWWVHDAMSKQVRQSRWPIAISEDSYRRALLIMSSHERLWKGLARPPEVEELASDLGWDLERLQQTRYRLALEDVLSIDMPIGEKGNATLVDFLVDSRGMYGSDPSEVDLVEVDSVAAAAAASLLEETMHDQLEAMPEKEREVISWRYGMKDGMSRTLKEVGSELGISPERARQIESRALRRLGQDPKLRSLAR